jgi:hypothetical protein
MFSPEFEEDNGSEIHIEGTSSSAAFKALLKYLYTDDLEVDDKVLFDLAKLCDQFQVEQLKTTVCTSYATTSLSRMQSCGWCRHTLPVVEVPCGPNWKARP